MAYTVCLDPGHNSSGADTGAEGNGLREQDLTLDIARRTRDLLQANGFTVVMTRDGDFVNGKHGSVTESLQTRCDISNNANANLFVAIHVNAGGGTGIEIYAISDRGRGVAQIVLSNLELASGMINRGVKYAADYVLKNTNAPAILTENGFIDAADADKLRDPDFRQKLAIAHAKGICQFFGVAYNAAPAVPAPAPQSAPPKPAGPAYPEHYLYKGLRGDPAVGVAEQRLKALGYYSGPIDNWFWRGMFTAVWNFQADHGLVKDGVIGPATWDKMFN